MDRSVDYKKPRIFFFSRVRLFLALALLVSTFFGSHLVANAAGETGATDVTGLPVISAIAENFLVSPAQLSQAVSDRKHQVAEFAFLAEWGQRHDCRVFAAGGTAAGLVHYVKADLEREWRSQYHLEQKYFASRFGYHYFDLYRSTQDADIVIDCAGDASLHETQAVALEQTIQQKFPHAQGSKSVWEVRFLRYDRNPDGGAAKKDALISSDFLQQHTDSHSTGLVEITTPPAGQNVIRDIKDWDNQKDPQFLRDVIEGELHYYFSPSHGSTARFQAGMNPAILSVIRYFVKAFQYGLKIRPEDRPQLQQIVDAFRPEIYQDPVFSYVLKQINSNGLKLFWHAQDVEFAAKTLDVFGLRQKLISLGGEGEGKMGTWLKRMPLPTKPIGTGKGKTASELGIQTVAHETNSLQALESMLRVQFGMPNVFMSIDGEPGQSAIYGDGFYTAQGTKGAKGTGLTIRFAVDPNAREGVDFILNDDYVIFLNRAALKVIDQSLEMTPVEYFKFLFRSTKLDRSDRGLLEIFKRKLNTQLAQMNPEQMQEVVELIQAHVQATQPNWAQKKILDYVKSPRPSWLQKKMNTYLIPADPNWMALQAWFAVGVSAQYPAIVEQLVQAGNCDPETFKSLLQQSHWKKNLAVLRQWFKCMVDSKTVPDKEIILLFVAPSIGSDHLDLAKEMVEILLKKGTVDKSIAWLFARSFWQADLSWAAARVERLLDKGTADGAIVEMLREPHWQGHPEWVERLLRKGTVDDQIAYHLLTQPHWQNHPEWLEQLILKGQDLFDIRKHVLPLWRDHPRLRELCGGEVPTVECLRAALLGQTIIAPTTLPLPFNGEPVSDGENCNQFLKQDWSLRSP